MTDLRGEAGDAVKNRKAEEAEDTDSQLEGGEERQRRAGVRARQRPAHQTSHAEAQHEGGDHDGDRGGVEPVDGEQYPLPDQLVDQGRRTGQEEHDENPDVQSALSA